MSKKNKKNNNDTQQRVQNNNLSIELERAIINANEKIISKENKEMNKIIHWLKTVLIIISIFLMLLFWAFIIAYGGLIIKNIISGKVF